MSAPNVVRQSIKSARVLRPPLVNWKKNTLTPEPSTKLSFADFREGIPAALEQKKEFGLGGGSVHDPVMRLFRQLDTSNWQDSLRKYLHTDPSRLYTRNLIDTDHETYTLLLLCWNPGKESCIHDHPSDGCWVKILQGMVRECRYRHMGDNSSSSINQEDKENDGPLYCYQDQTAHDGEIMYMEDSLGYHKIGNPGHCVAATLHLYSPPFHQCKTWASECDAPQDTPMSNYSEYGHKLET